MENINNNGGMNDSEKNVEETNVRHNKKLWNPVGFIILSILFSFLPAGVLYSLNYGRVGHKKRKNISLLIIIGAFIVLILISLFVSGTIMKVLFYGINVGVGSYMLNDQRDMFKEHLANGGRKASYIIPVIISVIAAGAVLALTISTSMNIPEDKLTYNGSEIYYTANVKKTEAEALGTYLNAQGLFSGSKRISLKIDKKGSVYRFSMIFNEAVLNEPETEQYGKDISEELSTYVFNKNKVEVIFCDKYFKPLKTVSK